MDEELGSFVPALGRISSGLFIVTTGTGENATGFLGSWVMQAGFEPPAVTVAVHRDRAVLGVLRKCGHFCLSVLSTSSMHYLKHFARGFQPGENAFEGLTTTAASTSEVPYLADAHAHLECEILGEQVWTNHVVVCGEVLAGSCRDLIEMPATHVRNSGLSY